MAITLALFAAAKQNGWLLLIGKSLMKFLRQSAGGCVPPGVVPVGASAGVSTSGSGKAAPVGGSVL
jgi:hypothetical protein